jgi:hypothetical protein
MTDHQGLPSMNQPLRGHSWDAKKHHDNASNEVIGTKGVNIVRTGRNVGQSFRFVYRGPSLSTRVPLEGCSYRLCLLVVLSVIVLVL